MARGEGWTFRIAEALAEACDVDLDVPFAKLPKKKREAVLYGVEGKRLAVKFGSEESASHGTWGCALKG